MEDKIAIIGYGDLGRQFHDFLSLDNKHEYIFFDDGLFEKQRGPNVFPFNEYLSPDNKNADFYVALGYHHLDKKQQIIEQLLELERTVPLFVHPTSFINISSSVGYGTFIYPMCNIDKNVKIGNGVLLNNSVCISHDCTVGHSSYLSPGVILSGKVDVGERTFIGSGAIISNNIKIGNDVIIGIGTVVTANIPDGHSALGNPAKIVKGKLNLI